MNNNIEISPKGNNLIYKNGYTRDSVLSIINENNLNGLKVNTRWERLNDLSFLAEYDFLESLDLVGPGDFDFSFLFSLNRLKNLSIGIVGANRIDLRMQRDLENLSLFWRKGKILGLEDCKRITSLTLIDYSERDFTPIQFMHQLEHLQIKTAQIINCNGLNGMYALQSILFGNCRRLSDLEAIGNLKMITTLSFDLCPQIMNFQAITNLINLEILNIVDCKEISSIKFVEPLFHLRNLALLGNTNVLDGDLIPAKRLQKVFYKHRKHYNVSLEE